MMLPKHPLHFPYLIFPKKNVQAAAAVPVHEDRRYVIHSRYRAPCTHRRRVRVVHTHQFHPCPDWVLFFLARKGAFYWPLIVRCYRNLMVSIPISIHQLHSSFGSSKKTSLASLIRLSKHFAGCVLVDFLSIQCNDCSHFNVLAFMCFFLWGLSPSSCIYITLRAHNSKSFFRLFMHFI